MLDNLESYVCIRVLNGSVTLLYGNGNSLLRQAVRGAERFVRCVPVKLLRHARHGEWQVGDTKQHAVTTSCRTASHEKAMTMANPTMFMARRRSSMATSRYSLSRRRNANNIPPHHSKDNQAG